MAWPATRAARNALVVSRRPPRPVLDPWTLQGLRVEDEPSREGPLLTATLFLTGRECPWRCAMCDLWRYTTVTATPPGAIPAQIQQGCERLAARGLQPSQLKLYNASSFFDPRAVPESDYEVIATRVAGFERVVVESHPSLVGGRLDRLRAQLRPRLQVAMGLETVHPVALAALNKQMDVRMFQRAASALAERGVSLRVFLLISPPFIEPAHQDEWLQRSLDVAVQAGAEVISLIPTRGGNGTLEALQQEGQFTPPIADMVHRSASLALAHVGDRAQVLLDPWDGTGVMDPTA